MSFSSPLDPICLFLLLQAISSYPPLFSLPDPLHYFCLSSSPPTYLASFLHCPFSDTHQIVHCPTDERG